MAWRILNGGQMIEVVTGHQDIAGGGQREVTLTRVGNAGEVIKGDLGQSLRERFAAEDPYVRSLVEYGEIEKDEDDDGNPVEVFVPKGLQIGGEPPQTDEEAQQRVAEAERVAQEAADNAEAAQKSAEEAQAQVADLQAQLEQANSDLETARGEVAAANEQLAGAITYDDLSKEALAAEAAAQGVDVKRADGKSGDPLKSDYAQALGGSSSS